MRTELHLDRNIRKVAFHSQLPIVEIGDIDSMVSTALFEASTEVTDGDFGILPVTIDSLGGDVYALQSIIDIWEGGGFDVCTYARGKAMSAGAILLAYGTPGLRFISPRCSYMLHYMNVSLQGNMGEVIASTKHTQEMQEKIMAEMAQRCGQEPDFFNELLVKGRGEVYLTPEQVVEYGIADRIGTPTIRREVRTVTQVLFEDAILFNRDTD